jgi:hypothetical protein
MPELESQCEDLWVKLDLVGNKSLVIRGNYKIEKNRIPKESPTRQN